MHFPEDIPMSVIEAAHEVPEISNPYTSLAQLEVACRGDETLEHCLEQVTLDSLRYAETVCRFEQIVLSKGQAANEDGEREEIERVRSTIHDSTIGAINALSRALKKVGKDNSWITKIRSADRAGYGKFAILIAFEAVLTNEKGIS